MTTLIIVVINKVIFEKEGLQMIDYYIHQIGNINAKRTYERLINILKSKAIYNLYKYSNEFIRK